jgi:threonine/homoserine/homoserine lactone efflux protein
VSEIAHAMGYMTGAAGLGFALAFGLYAGIKAATWAFGAIEVKTNVTQHVHHRTDTML